MYNLTSIEGIDYLNTSEVTNMAYMFSYCESLPSLDLSSFDTHHVTNMCYMFSYCSELQTVYVGDEWSTAAVTNSSGMFQGCTSIIGGMGTTYDANHVNKAYAHIDGGTSNPGYFTAKANFLRGDVNGDNQVNISDAIVLINYISNGNGNINLDAANVNNDNQVNITDAIMLINFISNGHW
jgi:surface protein